MSTDTLQETMESNESGDRESDDSGVAAAEIELLRAENERLREQFKQTKHTTYRRTAVAFLIVGVLSFGGAVLFPNVRTLLGAFGGTGVFAAILTYFVTPGEFHAASVSEHIFETTAKNGRDLVEELGLQETRIYVGIGEGSVRLFVPAHTQFSIPNESDLQSMFVVTGNERERGIALHPTGSELYSEFERVAPETGEIEQFGSQLADAVVEQFELARGVSTTVVPSSNEARFDISGSSCGRIRDFDQPIVSMLATGLAVKVGEPVRVEFSDDDDGLVRCVWGDKIQSK